MATDRPTPRPLLRAPTALALGLATLLTFGVAQVRSLPATMQQNLGESPARFWADKARVTARLDVVLAGDSRVFRGLAPEEMHSALAGARIGNLAFSGACLCGDYLPYLEGALARGDGGAEKTIVLGVTPHALTSHAALDNGFLAERRRTTRERLESTYLGPLEEALRPIDVGDLPLAVAPNARNGARYFQDFREGGWVASRLDPEKPNGALVEYERVLRDTKVEAAIVGELVTAVARWRERNIRVVAFRPPTTSEMRDLEDRLAAYDEAAFVKRFHEAGGEYWEITADGYHTYDGSHLDTGSARALSRDVAARLARR